MHVRCAVQVRSETRVSLVLIHCVSLHAVSAVQARSLLLVGSVVWKWGA